MILSDVKIKEIVILELQVVSDLILDEVLIEVICRLVLVLVGKTGEVMRVGGGREGREMLEI